MIWRNLFPRRSRAPETIPGLSRDETGRFTSDYRRLVHEKARQLRSEMPGREWRTEL